MDSENTVRMDTRSLPRAHFTSAQKQSEDVLNGGKISDLRKLRIEGFPEILSCS